MPTVNPNPTNWSVELLRIIPLTEAARLSSMSVDTLTRHYRDRIIELSPRRRGMRAGDALMLGTKATNTENSTT